MDDLISRTWLLAEYDKRHKGPSGGARKLIEEAPSALGTNLAEVGTDCITRQAAIDDIWTVSPLARLDRKWVDRWLRQLPSAQPEPPEECERCMMEHTDEMEKLEAELAMAQPKRGRWISADAIFGGVPFYCSECGENTLDTVMGKPRWNYCPMCGAKMEVTT